MQLQRAHGFRHGVIWGFYTDSLGVVWAYTVSIGLYSVVQGLYSFQRAWDVAHMYACLLESP